MYTPHPQAGTVNPEAHAPPGFIGMCALGIVILSIGLGAFVGFGQLLLLLARLIEWLGGPPVGTQGNYAFGVLMFVFLIAPFVLGDDDHTADSTAESEPHLRAQQQGPEGDEREGWRWGSTKTSKQRRSTTGTDHPPDIVAQRTTPSDATLTAEYYPVREVTGADIAAAMQRGELSGLMEAYPEQRLREYAAGAKPRPHTVRERIFGTKNDALNRSRDVFNDLADLSTSATAALRAANEFTDAKIKAATAKQQYDLEQAKLATAIAEQERRKAEHEAVKRRATGPPQQDHEQEQRRAAELAEKEHRARLSEIALKQALNEARIRGIQNPEAARRGRAQRTAAHNARPAEERTQVLKELERKARRALKTLEDLYGKDSDVYQHAANTWSAKITEAATEGKDL
ncbi:MAG: hypothetical protein HY270_06110 [Deltaproteobacteria bacterium]|nr:hypothetical protein [Deltaproteobacteria bacterium]